MNKQKEKTVVLFRPPCIHVLPSARDFFITDIFPLSIAHIVAVLEKEGFKVSVADPSDHGQYEPKEIIRRILREKPSVVGLSCFTANRFACKEIAEIVKKVDPGITVAFGGVLPTFLGELFLNHWPVDLVVPYEGEEVFAKACAAICRGYGLESVPGVLFKRHGGVVKTQPAAPIADLDSLPLPAYGHFARRTENLFGLFPAAEPVMRMDTSRGCPGGCTFCSTVKMWHRKVRYYSLDRVFREITLVRRKFKTRVFAFTDINFATHPQRIREFCQRLLSGKSGVEWVCATRADGRLMPEDYRLMKEAGCRMIQFGVESFSGRILKSIDKGIDAATQLSVLDHAHAAGIDIGINLILGFPGETEETLQETLDTVNSRIPPMRCFDVERLKLTPGSLIYEQEVAAGRFKESAWLSTDNIWHVYSPDQAFSALCDRYKGLIEESLRSRSCGPGQNSWCVL